MRVPRYIFVILAIMLLLLLMRIFLIGSYRIEGNHVDIALKNGDYVWVNKLKYKGCLPSRGLLLYKSPLRRDAEKPPLLVGRCIGTPGDTVRIGGNEIRVNGKPAANVSMLQQTYRIKKEIKEQLYAIMESLRIPLRNVQEDSISIVLQMSQHELELLRNNLSDVVKMETIEHEEHTHYTFVIPQKNKPIRISDALDIYKETIIKEYGEKRASFRDNKFILDGIGYDYIRFRNDYYWILSESEESIDSRHLGLIPKSHIVGNIWFCWYSKDGSRRFKTIH